MFKWFHLIMLIINIACFIWMLVIGSHVAALANLAAAALLGSQRLMWDWLEVKVPFTNWRI